MFAGKRWADLNEKDILEANILKYNDDNIIRFYEDNEEFKYAYIEYDIIFNIVIKFLSRECREPIKAVDMCGGAGKATYILKKHDPECEVTLVDVSAKMLNIAREKVNKYGVSKVKIVESDVFSFLDEPYEYDLIIFSSAIHHFKDPVELLKTAANRLSDRGIIITIADPTTLIRSKRYRFLQFLISNRTVKLQICKHLIQRIFNSSWSEQAAVKDWTCDINNISDVAEYQTLSGIDDKFLVSRLKFYELYPLLHFRYPAGDYSLSKIMSLLRISWAFALILKKGHHNNELEHSLEWEKKIKKEMPFRIELL